MSLYATDSVNAITTTWLTPLPLIEQLGEFDLDPCAYPGHQTATKLITLPTDGLNAEWSGRVWLNPPYGKEAAAWMKKLKEHDNGIALIFARLETKWIQPFIENGFFQLEGRISFLSPDGLSKGNSGAPSILIPFGRKNIGAILKSDLKGKWFQ